jgi:ABC-type uncharacterized transport system permease subunit
MNQFIQTIILSFIIIYLIDKLITYFRDTYTTKKTKDMVGFHIKKYQSIMDKMIESKNDPTSVSNTISEQELSYMNDELESVLRTELDSLSQ